MEYKIPQETIDDLKSNFMGKKISVIDGEGERWIGTCQFLGYNPNFPSWNLQVTLDRTPIPNVKLSSIKIYEKVY